MMTSDNRRDVPSRSPAGVGGPLLPSQARFFAQGPNPTQDVVRVIYEPTRLDASVFAQAIDIVARHHESLSTQFRQTKSGWEQFQSTTPSTRIITHHDLSGVGPGADKSALEHVASEMVDSITLGEGGMMRVATIDLGWEPGTRVLLMVHHLAVDYLSWRILVDDIERVYRRLLQSRTGGSVELSLGPATSARAWAEWHHSPVAARFALRELAAWRRRELVPLPLDTSLERSRYTALIARDLSRDATGALLEAARRRRVNVGVFLVSALARVIAEWCKASNVGIDVTSHGRRPVPRGVNLARTVGWLAREAPLFVTVPTNAAAALDATLSAFDRRPSSGLGYNILRFSTDDAVLSHRSVLHQDGEVGFNCVGSPFRAAVHSSGLLVQAENASHDGEQLRPPPLRNGGPPTRRLDLQCRLSARGVRASWLFEASVLSRATVEGLADRFEEVVRTLAGV